MKPLIQRHWPVLLTVGISGYGLLAWYSGESSLVEAIGHVALLLITAWAAFKVLSLAQALEYAYTRRAWLYIGVGLALWTVAEAIESFFGIVLALNPNTPSLIDLIRLAGSMAFIVAFAILPSRMYGGFGRIRDILDISLMISGSLTLFWLIFFRSILRSGLADPIPAFWAQVHGALGLILLPLILYRVSQSSRPRESSSYLTFGGGVLVISVSQIIKGYQELRGPSGQVGWIDAGAILGTSFIIYAAYVFQRKMVAFWRKDKEEEFRPSRWRIDAILPMAFIYGVIGFLLLDWWLTGGVDQFALQSTVLMAVLLITRQGAIIGQSELSKYAELVNATADMAFVCDQEGQIILDNPSLREAIGTASHEESLPELSEILISSMSIEKLLSVASISGWVGEVRFRRNNGSSFPASLSLIPIEDERHQQLLLAATAHDLTTVKRREDDLRDAMGKLAEAQKDLQSLNVELERKVELRTEELEEMVSHLEKLNEELQALDQMKTEFVALVSHELRAPLTNIQTGLEVVLDSVDEAEMSDSLELIMAETTRLGEFVETILDLSSLEAGKFPIQMRSLSLREIVMEVCAKFEKQSGGDRIRMNIADDLPHIHADDQGLRSVIYHLLDNALKYAPEGRIELDAFGGDSYVTLSISDSGPGIPEDQREQVFEMFYRMDTRDSRAVYGRGLGLNLAKRFLEVMEGGIEIGGSPTGGTQVRFWLPIEDPADRKRKTMDRASQAEG